MLLGKYIIAQCRLFVNTNSILLLIPKSLRVDVSNSTISIIARIYNTNNKTAIIASLDVAVLAR